MKRIAVDEFLEWTSGKGMFLDPQYPSSKVLSYRAGDDWRFWVVPKQSTRRPLLALALLELLGSWERCYVWRHLGRWPEPNDPLWRHSIDSEVELQLLQGLGLAAGTSDVLVFDRGEIKTLVSAMFLTMTFGRAVADDYYIVPDHGRQFLKMDHHEAIQATFPVGDTTEAEIAVWVETMAKKRFFLPDELPDETFKPVDWMKDK